MRDWLVPLIAGVLLCPFLAHAEPGDRVPVPVKFNNTPPLAEFQLWAPGPDGNQNFLNSLKNISDVLQTYYAKDHQYIENFKLASNGSGQSATATFTVKMNRFEKMLFHGNNGNITMGVHPISCNHASGYELTFDFSKSTINIVNSYSDLELDLCDPRVAANGTLLINAKAYVTEGPNMDVLVGPEILNYMENYALPALENILEDHFTQQTKAGSPK